MAEANPYKGIVVDEDRDKLVIRCRVNLNAGIAMTGMALAFGLPIGLFAILKTPLSEDDLSFVCVFGPVLALVLFLGIRILVNNTILTADENQLIVQVRPLPFTKAKKLSAADLQWLEIGEKVHVGKHRSVLHLTLLARHQDASSTRLIVFKGIEYTEAANFVKEKLEGKLGLWSEN